MKPERFKDSDRHRDGTITVPQFQQALAMTFGRYRPLSEQDLALLVKTYAVDKSGQTHIRWTEFVAHINSIFTKANLEKTPNALAPPLPPKLPRPTAALSPEEEDKAQAILARLRGYCTRRRVQ